MDAKQWSEELIERMQANRERLQRIADPVLREAFRSAICHGIPLLFYTSIKEVKIECNDADRLGDAICRLPADWTRPEPEPEAEPEKWIYCEVNPGRTAWVVANVPGYQVGERPTLGVALNLIGCGGVEFKENPGTFYVDGHIRYVVAGSVLAYQTTREDLPLGTPNRVRFHRPTLVKFGMITL